MMLFQNNQFKFTPSKGLSTLQSMTKSTKTPFSLDQFISYCYYTIKQFIDCNKRKLDQKAIQYINNHPVYAKQMPCLIYQHLSETFCSLVQAHRDNDMQLVQIQVEQIIQTINSYRPNCPHGSYQSFNDLQIDQNKADTYLKQNFQIRITKLMDECLKLNFQTTKQLNNQKKRNLIPIILKEKRQKLNKRQVERVRPLISKLIQKGVNVNEQNNPQIQKDNQEKEFVLCQAFSKASA